MSLIMALPSINKYRHCTIWGSAQVIGPAGQQTYRAIVLINLTSTTAAITTTAILSNSSQLNAAKSVNFQARCTKFSMEVDLDLTQLDLTSILTSALALTSTSDIRV